MSLGLQSKLLHALQDGAYTPLGSEKGVQTDTWVIAATNHELKQDIMEERFRKDLYYRLSTVTIQIEPLRKRPEDIPYLIEYYTKKYALRFNEKKPKSLSRNTLDKLTAYHWPGNVRELQNVLKRLMVFGVDEDNIDDMLSVFNGSNPAVSKQRLRQNSSNMISDLKLNGEQMPDLSSLSLKKIRKRVKSQIDREVIQYVLEKTDWNRTRTTKILDISYKTLLTKIHDLNIQPLDFNE
jgi:DNA-binding NtrC family response regulator